MGLKHVVLTNPRVHGFQYGMQRDCEDELLRLTGGSEVVAPSWRAPEFIRRRLRHGTRLARLRELVPRTQELGIDADVLWVVLMGPEGTDLDVLKRWDNHSGFRILYIFDTFTLQLPALRRLVSKVRWDLTVTSFHSAIPVLERETGRTWHAVAQGVKPSHFTPANASERRIAFSSYGRRLVTIHRAIDEWTTSKGLYYDVSVAASPHPDLDARYLYRQYAWHLRQSWFTFCWPVEVTHPQRAEALSPVTCRWFEAAASGVPMIGQAPRDPVFVELFGEDAVIPMDPASPSPKHVSEFLEEVWSCREEHVRHALERRKTRLHQWTWESRVRQLLSLAGFSPSPNVDGQENA